MDLYVWTLTWFVAGCGCGCISVSFLPRHRIAVGVGFVLCRCVKDFVLRKWRDWRWEQTKLLRIGYSFFFTVAVMPPHPPLIEFHTKNMRKVHTEQTPSCLGFFLPFIHSLTHNLIVPTASIHSLVLFYNYDGNWKWETRRYQRIGEGYIHIYITYSMFLLCILCVYENSRNDSCTLLFAIESSFDMGLGGASERGMKEPWRASCIRNQIDRSKLYLDVAPNRYDCLYYKWKTRGDSDMKVHWCRAYYIRRGGCCPWFLFFFPSVWSLRGRMEA